MPSLPSSNTSTISPLLSQLNQAHLRHNDIAPLIDALKNQTNLNVQLIGHSFEQRPIHLLTLGNGPIVIFAWTQMHGNEATATAAVFDLIDTLLSTEQATMAPVNWSSQFTLHILPMLNPDGAERCIRQNAQGIDINRDALTLQSPEGKLLMHMAEQLSPDVGFNLHDQSPYYQVGTNGNPATIAFLAPAFDYQKTIDASRNKAMQIIAHMNTAIQKDITDCVARYDDTFSPRSFGDNIAGKNISTILIESGAAVNDPNRQIARRMNLVAMLNAMQFLANDNALPTNKENENTTAYFAIPENTSETLSSLVIRDLCFKHKQYSYCAGISIKQTARYSNNFLIDFIGSLGHQAGLHELNAQANDLIYVQGKKYEVTKALSLNEAQFIALLKDGYIVFDDPNNLLEINTSYKVYKGAELLGTPYAFELHQPAYCLFTSKKAKQKIIGAMVNGQLIFW